MDAAVEITILVYPETSGSVVYGFYDLFSSAGRDWRFVTEGQLGQPLLKPVLASRSTTAFKAVNNVPIVPERSLDAAAGSQVICIPEVFVAQEEPLAERFAPEIQWLKQCYENGAILAAACSGAMLLAEAGLLDGCEATTHWAWCDALQQRFPTVKVNGRRALVASGEGQRLIMAGGGTSWLDLALFLIARTAGIEAAMQVARINLIDWHRVGQQPYARLACTRQVEDATVARCQVWIADNYAQASPVSKMVALAGLPERTFKRRFQAATGLSPLAYVHALRLEEAKQLLEASELSVEAIANEVGYDDAAYFSRLFKREVNLTPAEYRRRFGALRRSLMSDS